MANLFTSIGNRIGQAIGGWLSPYMGGISPTYDLPAEDLARRYAILRNYYNGDHRPQLKTPEGGQDDNITYNWIGNIEDKGNSRMLRGDVKFNLPEGATKQQEYIDKVWELNKKKIILHQYRLHGGVYGTTYFKICPDELIDPYTSKLYPRLIPLDPETVRINPNPEDVNDVGSYVIEYMTKQTDANGYIRVIGHREITRRVREGDMSKPLNEGEEAIQLATDTWIIEEWIKSPESGDKWMLIESIPWGYTFPNIIHQKNLPSLRSCYGDSDFDDVVNLQDKNNFTNSNLAKIIKFFAAPITFIFGISAKTMKENKLDSAVGSLYAIPSENAKAMNLEMNSDLASSRQVSQDSKAAIYEISRELSTDSIGDKLGQLTNFGLRVLNIDALDKTETQRQLYGDALLELNRRLLVLANYEGEQSNPGSITWGEALIVNDKEEMEVDQLALDMGIIDKETIIKRWVQRYGVKYDDVIERMKAEKPAPPPTPPNPPDTPLMNKGIPVMFNQSNMMNQNRGQNG